MNRITVACILFLMIALTGCVETIALDPEEKDLPIMVNCILYPNESVQTLYLQQVKGKSAGEYHPVKDAKVYVTGSLLGKMDTLFFHHVDGNVWESRDKNKIVQSGKKYSLKVEISGRDAICAETICPIAYRPECYIDPGEIPSTSSYSIYFQVHDYQDEWKEMRTSPVWVFAKGIHKTFEESDEYYPYLVTDHPYADDFNINGKKFKDLPLNGESDGVVCVISWFAFHNMRRLMPELPLHDDFVRFGHLDDNRFHLLAGPLDCPKSGEPHQDHFVFAFVSEEYDIYLRSVYVKNKKLDHDITSIYSTENVYSNIEGGVGIFGSEINYRVAFMVN